MGRKAIPYLVTAVTSWSMLSDNPLTGFKETDISRTVDTTNPNPTKNQGGILIVEVDDADD